ncbi:SPFH domain-containing protein [Hyalangium rubrum]|uniref:Protein QmcA n=1 Tax=Hyalangium rubrum TaxID=3103134 RepID=A0ABU5HDQ9_9BACT|nr:SPFH domain-containing protein [Hyalangium sp. s54d21]MDY7230953.1 SPFH domain-containing protein [Hyalangium sp. s54d21]
MTFMTVVIIIAMLVVGFGLITGIRIVPQAKVMVVERLGKFHHVAHSGLNILIPVMDTPRAFEMRTGNRFLRSTMVDLREQVMGFETVQVITHDNVNMEVGSVIYYQVIDPAKALYAVENLALAIEQLTMTNLRNIMGGLTLDQTLTSRETVNTKLRMVLDEATEKWGVKVTRVELREIEPPGAIKEAMAKQMTAERERRAEVTKAEGDKAAAILQAEGEKISRILRAEAERDAEVARAEGHKRAVVLEAEAKAEATRLVFEAVHAGGATPEVLALRYLETLQELGKGGNKVFVPYEASAALGSLGMLKELFNKEGDATPTAGSRLAPSAAALSAQALARNVAQPQPVPVRRGPPALPQQDE